MEAASVFSTTRPRGSAVPLTAGSIAAGLLVLTALGRGGEAAWAEGLFLLAAACGWAAFALAHVPLPRPLRIAAFLWVFFAAWCWVQSFHLPALAHPLWAAAAEALAGSPPVSIAHSIALDPYEAQTDALRLVGYAGLFALGLVLAHSNRSTATLKITAAVIALFCLAALALVPAQPSAELGKVRHAADAVFPFTSRNTFCAFAGTALVIAAASLAPARTATGGRGSATGGRGSATGGRGSATGGKARLFWLAAGLIATVAVVTSHSRAGLAATAISVAVALVVARPDRATLLWAAIAGVGLALASLATLTGLRLASLPDDLSIRLAIWEASAEIAARHFWLGLGSLDQALQMAPGQWGDRHILRAHNIYLQAVAERGLPAALAALAAVGLAACQAVRSIRKATPSGGIASAAALGVLALFATHGLVDFSLYAPANAAILALLLGLACGSPRPALPQGSPFATNAHLSHF